jgi:hypothetical protein
MLSQNGFDLTLDGLLAMGENDTPTQRPQRVVLEHVLMVGYAEALELEAERLRVARTLDRALEDLRDPMIGAEVARLRADLGRMTERLVELRNRLAEANRRFGPITPAVR